MLLHCLEGRWLWKDPQYVKLNEKGLDPSGDRGDYYDKCFLRSRAA